jgi:hypothetical protein
MIILTFAHKGEAAEFIRRKHTLRVDFYFSGLYRDHDELLLVTGSRQKAERLEKVCSYFGNRIQAVLNLGIAGALHAGMEMNQIYGIRHSIHELKEGGFDCVSRRAVSTCITTEKPVTYEDHRAALRDRGADCADMETWWQAELCDRINLPFQSYKLISDAADLSVDQANIIGEASFFSKHLFDFYKKLDYAFLINRDRSAAPER